MIGRLCPLISVLSKEFSLAVFNKFKSLSTTEVNDENVEDVYDTLIKSTEEIALSTLSKKEKRKKSKPSNFLSVVDARNHLKAVSSKYHRSPTKPLKIQLITAKKNLDDAYLNAEVDFINGKIDKLSKVWKAVGDLWPPMNMLYKIIRNFIQRRDYSYFPVVGIS